MNKDKFSFFEAISSIIRPKDLIKKMKKRAIKGDIEALYFMALTYYEGFGVEEDVKKAVYYLEKLADKDHIYSLHILAEIYSNGKGNVKEDSEKYLYYIKKLAELGDSDAIMILANFMDKLIQEDVLDPEQLGLAEDSLLGLYQDAAKEGHIEAGVQYALLMEEKRASMMEVLGGEPKDLSIEDDVLEYLQRAALDEDPIALQYLGSVYEEGRENLIQSDAIAMLCYKAAHLLDPEGCHEYTHFKKEHEERALMKSEKNDFTSELAKLLAKLEKR